MLDRFEPQSPVFFPDSLHDLSSEVPVQSPQQPQTAERSARGAETPLQSPDLSQAGDSRPAGRAMNAVSQIPQETPGFVLSSCLEKLFPELNSTPSFNLTTPPWVNIITFQVWALHRKRSGHIGMIFSTGHSLKCHQKYLEGRSCFSFAISPKVRTPQCVCSRRGFVVCTRTFVQ